MKNNLEGLFPTFMLESLVIIYRFCDKCIDIRYGQHYMSDFLISVRRISWCRFLTLMMALMIIIFKILILIGAGELDNIL